MVDTMPIIIVSTVFITLISYMLIDSFWDGNQPESDV